jgi:long-subunit acyl-CoA synthetase (AMP-forming)
VSDREACYSTFFSGGRTGITWDVSHLWDDLPILSPSSLAATPRFFNVIYSEFQRVFQSERDALLLQHHTAATHRKAKQDDDESDEEESAGTGLDAHAVEELRRAVLARFRRMLGHRLKSIGLGE